MSSPSGKIILYTLLARIFLWYVLLESNIIHCLCPFFPSVGQILEYINYDIFIFGTANAQHEAENMENAQKCLLN